MSTGVGKRIKQRRKELGLSQEELASRMGFKSKQSISNVEIGRDNLTADRVTAFAKALDQATRFDDRITDVLSTKGTLA